MIFNRCLCHGYVENYAAMWTIWRLMCEDPAHYYGHSHPLVDAVERSGRSQDSGILKTLACLAFQSIIFRGQFHKVQLTCCFSIAIVRPSIFSSAHLRASLNKQECSCTLWERNLMQFYSFD